MELPGPGQLFENRYRIEHELGAGGFSRVYLAIDEGAGRPVALKILTPDPDGYDAQTRARFQREVQVIAGLRDPHTVTLYNHGTSADGLLYMVFEHVPGTDLADVLSRHGRLAADAVTDVLRQVLEALREAHGAGLVHRDIKPENIRVCSPPGQTIELKLLDFGIARSTDDGHPSITKTGELIGTPRYMSPEQLTEQPLTPASDIYSLGMVAFELLVGRDGLPGHGWAEQLGRLRSGHVFGVDELTRIDPRLLPVIQRMTAREAEQRYPSATAVLAALDEPAVAPPPTTLGQPVAAAADPPRSETTPWPLIGIAGLVLLLIAIAVVALWKLTRDAGPTDVVPMSTRPISSIVRVPDAGARAIERVEPEAQAGATANAADLVTLPDGGSAGCGVTAPVSSDDTRVILPTGYDARRPHPAVVWIAADREDPLHVPGSEVFASFQNSERVVAIVPIDRLFWTPAQLEEIRRRVRRVGEEYCLDPHRVFIMSSGRAGRLAKELACEPWVAGVAINSHIDDKKDRARCEAPRPTLWITPLDSVNQPYEGGMNCFNIAKRPFAETRRELRQMHGCRGDARETHRESTGHCETWNCNVPFEVCGVHGGQGWPGAPRTRLSNFGQLLGVCPEPAPTVFDATGQMWRFFDGARSPVSVDDVTNR